MSWVAVAVGGISTAGGLIANNQANKAAQSAANAAQIDPVEQARQSLDLQIQYAPQILDLERELQPGYADLANSVLSQQLLGTGGQFDINAYWNSRSAADRERYEAEGAKQGISGTEWLRRTVEEQAQRGNAHDQQVLQQYRTTDPNSLMGIYQAAQPGLSNLQAQTNTAQRTADINDVTNLGGAATAAYRAANPQLQAATDALQSNIFAQREAGPGAQVNQREATATTAGPAATAQQQVAQGSPLLGRLEADAGNALTNRTGLQQELERQAMAELQTGGRLSAEATRDAEQAVRAAAADRGMVMSNSTIFNEALNKEQLTRQRQAEARALGLTVDAAGQAQTQQNRNYALGVSDRGTALNTFNASQGNQLAATNAAATNQQNQFNAGVLTNNSQFNAAQGNQLGQFNAELSRALDNDQFNREFGLTQLLQSQSVDPYSLVLGRGTAAPQAFGAAAQAGAMQTGPQFSTLFDPTVSSIANNNANANAAAGNARANNWGALSGSIFGGGFGLLGDMIGGGMFGGGNTGNPGGG